MQPLHQFNVLCAAERVDAQMNREIQRAILSHAGMYQNAHGSPITADQLNRALPYHLDAWYERLALLIDGGQVVCAQLSDQPEPVDLTDVSVRVTPAGFEWLLAADSALCPGR